MKTKKSQNGIIRQIEIQSITRRSDFSDVNWMFWICFMLMCECG
jgi:hypothetical protein